MINLWAFAFLLKHPIFPRHFGSHLKDMKAIQELIISIGQRLVSEVNDEQIRNDIQKMLESDQKNLEVLDTAIVQYGVKGEPKQTIQQLVEKTQQMMGDSGLSLYEKVTQFELLKHGQTMSGIVIHKAAQVVGKIVQSLV